MVSEYQLKPLRALRLAISSNSFTLSVGRSFVWSLRAKMISHEILDTFDTLRAIGTIVNRTQSI